MELKDNFTNRYFKPGLVKTQMDLINQPTATDAYSDAFTQAGKQPAKGPEDHEANALMTGFGAGLKGSADDKRQEKLDPLLKMTGQINAQSAYLEAQMQEEQQETMQVQQFVKGQSYAFSELAKASTAGDTPASNNIARGILQQYKNTSGDPIIGDFDHYHDGIIYYSNAETGEKGGLSVSQLISQSGEEGAQSLGADYPLIMSAFSTGFKGKYENTQELERLERDKLQANIDNTKAQTGLYGSQTQKTENDIANPPMSKNDELTFKLNSEGNNKHLNDLKSYITEKDLPTKILVLEKMDKLIESESSAGGSPKDMLYRSLKKLSGKDEKLTEAKILQKYFFADIKGIAGNPNAEEWNDLVSRIVSPEQNINASRSIIEFEKNQAQNTIHEYQDYAKILSEDNPNNLSHHHPEITKKIEGNKDSRQFVKMVDPDTGEQDRIKKSDIKEAEDLGLRLVK